MEQAERRYFDTPKRAKKHVLRLTQYISELLENGRIHEARYFFKKLHILKPKNINTARLGYSISISIFDELAVREFDILLQQCLAEKVEVEWFRLKFYQSRNNYTYTTKTIEILLSHNLKREYLSSVVEACLNQNNYKVAAMLATYLDEKSIRLQSHVEAHLKKITITELANTILKGRNA